MMRVFHPIFFRVQIDRTKCKQTRENELEQLGKVIVSINFMFHSNVLGIFQQFFALFLDSKTN